MSSPDPDGTPTPSPFQTMTPLLLFFFLSVTVTVTVHSDPSPQENTALLSFLSQTPHLNRIFWNPSTSPCDWTGVKCNPARSTVTELHLPAVGLVGPIPPNTLSRLPNLRVLSLRRNAISGPIPNDLSKLTRLFSLYLQDNAIAGDFPQTLTSLSRLNRLDLAGNKLSGQIPFALNNLTQLTVLLLDRNNFTGKLPSINITSLASFNVSYNSLNGSIPESLAHFSKSSFAGNLALCGGPLPPCTPFFPSPSPSPSVASSFGGGGGSKKLSTGAIIGIVAGIVGFLILLLLAGLIVWLVRRRKKREASSKTVKPPVVTSAAVPGTASREMGMTSSSKDEMSGVVEGERNRLAFVGKEGGYSFDLEDLLRASAEVLGKGSVGTSYKAILEEGTTVVVKRLKDVVVSKREFEVHMEEIGKIDEHRNVLPLRAYYYSKDEKLLVFDFLAAGSLSSVLHGE